MSPSNFSRVQNFQLGSCIDEKYAQAKTSFDWKHLQTPLLAEEKNSSSSSQSSRRNDKKKHPKRLAKARAASLPLSGHSFIIQKQSQTWPILAPSEYDTQIEAASDVASWNDYSLQRWLGAQQTEDGSVGFTKFGYDLTSSPSVAPEQGNREQLKSNLAIDTKCAGYWDPRYDWNMTDVTGNAVNFHFYPEDLEDTAPYDQVNSRAAKVPNKIARPVSG